MIQLVRWLVFVVVLGISGGALARPSTCRSAPAEAVTLQLIDQAGELELYLQKILTETKSQSTAHEASRKLAVLIQYVEALLEPHRTFSLIEIHEGLERLPVFKEELPPLPAVTLKNTNPYQLQVVMQRKAEKDFADLPHYIRAKFLEFVSEASGLVAIEHLSAHWSLKHLTQTEEAPPNSFTVRLNRGYRVFFTVNGGRSALSAGKTITIYRVSMKATHDGH